jgi:hypothetical protein
LRWPKKHTGQTLGKACETPCRTTAKFERHLPTYQHQEMLVGPLGLWLSRPLLWKLLAGTAL